MLGMREAEHVAAEYVAAAEEVKVKVVGLQVVVVVSMVGEEILEVKEVDSVAGAAVVVLVEAQAMGADLAVATEVVVMVVERVAAWVGAVPAMNRAAPRQSPHIQLSGC